jgi:hypothetical protein
VPSAGLRWLVRGAPAKLAESQSFRPALDVLFSEQRLRASAKANGFAFETLTRAVIAGFDLGTLYLVELPEPTAETARERFAARQIHQASKRTPDPNIVVLSGISDGVPVGLVTLDDRALAYGVGDPTLWRVVEAYARGRLHAKRAFEGVALAGQQSETDGAFLAAHVPGPFDERWQQAAGGLLQVATSLSAKLTPTGPEHALLQLVVHGDFKDSNAAERLRSAYMSVAGSSTGALLGLAGALEARAELSPNADRVILAVPLQTTEIAKGARAAANADLTEIFGLPKASRVDDTPTLAPESR